MRSIIDDEFAFRVEQEIQRCLAAWQIRGASIIIVQHDSHNILTFGQRDEHSPVTPSTRFALASNSKLITALLLVRALASNSPPLPVNTPIKAILPSFRLANPLAEAECTVEDILSHRTGLPGYDEMFEPGYVMGELVERLATLELSGGFRERHQYNSILFDLAAILVEKLTGQAFDVYAHEQLFQPLGLTSATFYHTPDQGEFAKSFWQRVDQNGEGDEGRWIEYGIERCQGAIGTGRLWMDSNDMAKWTQALPSIPEYAEAVIPRTIAGAAGGLEFPDQTVLYGLAHRASTHRGVLIHEHGGEIPGFLSKVARLPEYNAGFAILCNSDPGGKYLRALVKCRMIEYFASLPRKDWFAVLDAKRQGAFRSFSAVSIRAPFTSDELAVDVSSLVDTWSSPGFATWIIDHHQVVPSLPAEMGSLPFVASLYGSVELIFSPAPSSLLEDGSTNVGKKGERWNGCKAWTSYDTGEVFFGDPFHIEVVDNRMKVVGMTGVGEGLSEEDWPIWFSRSV
ncbi:hypothetical protein L198_00108 [Cryptococcus wingfieldii CBS 7118]|uniref:Beta-lactamase-related domain-containing protein n=1 Tax=Cryptococcus wingfieldii CBS 7118 TaxID=1295528 RepID=A0A1E3K691_9TREE|nr:hypothetical protein L198_00108 [Cryptococcus wingfieldii CBS 7118]ODO08383.1 hypothetical protein L198_00108 [Cryptococcus wingfieldii CBS 7118]